MKNLLNPRWLFVINTLPIALLFALFGAQFNIIKSLMSERDIHAWVLFGLTLGTLGSLNFAYALHLTMRKKKVSGWYGVLALLCYIPFVYVYSYNIGTIIPSAVPQWMLADNLFLYVGTFIMPTLAYSLFLLVLYFTPSDKEHQVGVNFFISIGIPVFWYLIAQLILPLWHVFDNEYGMHAIVIIVITGTLTFLFFLVRGIYILITKRAQGLQKYQLIWKIPLTLILPLIGLLVNSGRIYGSYGDSGIFGDFDDPWFYILAVVNGVLMCLPAVHNKIYRILLFMGRSITFAFSFYFFIVFLPFLPLSVIAIVAIGLGFLLLAPLLLFVIHINEMSVDYKYLRNYMSSAKVIVISCLCFMVIPVCITARYLNDKRVLNETLAYLYSPDYSKQYQIDKTSIRKTLNVIKELKDNRGGSLTGSRIPYLSTYFNWLVLDNLILSDTKINYIERVFFNEAPLRQWSQDIRDEHVKISGISVRSTFDKNQNAWRSWVDLEIKNHDENRRFAEYACSFDLPEGCWISDYYLYVGNKKEAGILAEKKSAMWVFSNIRNENRDPGMLHYLTGNKVAFRVFPFSAGETRKTGIEFLHKGPVSLNLDGRIVELGKEAASAEGQQETENVVFLSANQKRSLKAVKRKPYFHFLVDVSEGTKKYSSSFAKRIEKVLKEKKINAADAKISLVSGDVSTFSLDKSWKEHFKSQTYEGGFFLDRALRSALFHGYKNSSYPVFVVVTDSIKRAVIEKDLSDLKFTFPESDLFFDLDQYGNLKPHSLTHDPATALRDSASLAFDHSVLEYKLPDNTLVYLPDNDQPSIILKKDLFETTNEELKEKRWLSALTLQAKWRSQTLHPEIADQEWLNLVKSSFITKVLTPVTAYLVVENEAQKAILKKKQEEVLSGNRSFDVQEDAQRMSEPGLWVLILLFCLVMWLKNMKERKALG